MASVRPWACILCLRKNISALTSRTTALSSVSMKDKFIGIKVLRRSQCTVASDTTEQQRRKETKPTTKAITISRAMRLYMDKVKEHDDLMKAEVADFEIGKRHLAHIMGVDPDSFTQEDVNRAIEYLLPSGIFDKEARPMLKNPYEIFPRRKAAQFGLDGKPYHWMYFTVLPNYYNVLYDINWKIEDLKAEEDKMWKKKTETEEIEKKSLNLSSSEWISYLNFKERMWENIQEKEYNHFIVLMERLVSHPLAHKEEEFIMSFRTPISLQSLELKPPQVQTDETGKFYAVANGKRKTSFAKVTLYKPGSGKFLINDTDLTYFDNQLCRETMMLPLMLTDNLNIVDIVAQVEGGGETSQAGAIRIALSQTLTAFVDDQTKEQMRLAGLLTKDMRRRERKKPGQEKARKKFTWKKR